MLNQVQLIGRLVREPELKNISKNDTPNLQLRNAIAVDDDFVKDKSHFFNFTAWKNNATFIGNFAHKGDLICIVGKLSQNTWQDQNGVNKESIEIVVDKSYILEKKKQDEPTEKPYDNRIDLDKVDVSDDDLPF